MHKIIKMLNLQILLTTVYFNKYMRDIFFFSDPIGREIKTTVKIR